MKIIASDMDGTLLNSKSILSEENLKAIKYAIDKGIKFIIATGRGYEDIKPMLEEWGLKCPCILMNGAEFRDEEGNILETINMEKNQVKDILNTINKWNLVNEIYTNKGFFTPNTEEEVFTGMAYRVMNFEKNLTFEEAYEKGKTHYHLNRLKPIENLDEFLASDVEIRKIISFHYEESYVKKVKEEILKFKNLAVLSSFVTNIEITNIEAQKGIILAKVAEKLNIPKDEVMIFGDGLNDYSLFTEFKNSFAMENAVDEIKNIATYITDTNDNNGVAKGIYKMIK